MRPSFLYLCVFFMFFCVRDCFAFGWQAWLEVSSVVRPNTVSINFPSIIRQGDYLKVTYNIPGGVAYNGTLRNNYGPQSCSEPYNNMELGGVLKVPNKISAKLIDLEFVSVDTPVKQIFKFIDGAVGIYDINGTTPNSCQYYVKQLDKHSNGWYGTGRSIVVTYQVVKLKGIGQDTLVIDTAFTPTRRQENAQPWIDGNHIKDNLGSSSTTPYLVVDYCPLDVNSAEGVTLDHGTLTPDLVNGHRVSKVINFSCTNGTSADVTLYLSNYKGENDIILSNGYTSSLHLDKTKLSIPRGGKESVELSSTLNNSTVVAGAFEGHDILTVLFD